MGFSKIHDYYEYPETLDLTRYLAEDSPQLSSRGNSDRMSGTEGSEGVVGKEGENKPIYTLHSVLVHQGDVGGGHYYAYIKPSGNTQLKSGGAGQDPLKSGGAEKDSLKSGGGWYKFNDETVLHVTQKEVFTSNFGKKISSFKNYHNYDSLGSAYMLVYIQLCHINDIMIPVDETSIPTDLKQRLHKFEFQKYIYNIYYNQINNKLLYNKQYILEEDIAKFNKYTSKIDFVYIDTTSTIPTTTNTSNNTNNIRYIQCITNCTTLYYTLKISYTLNIPIYRIRLWIIERYDNNKLHNNICRWRIHKYLPISLSTTINVELNTFAIFIEILPEHYFTTNTNNMTSIYNYNICNNNIIEKEKQIQYQIYETLCILLCHKFDLLTSKLPSVINLTLAINNMTTEERQRAVATFTEYMDSSNTTTNTNTTNNTATNANNSTTNTSININAPSRNIQGVDIARKIKELFVIGTGVHLFDVFYNNNNMQYKAILEPLCDQLNLLGEELLHELVSVVQSATLPSVESATYGTGSEVDNVYDDSLVEGLVAEEKKYIVIYKIFDPYYELQRSAAFNRMYTTTSLIPAHMMVVEDEDERSTMSTADSSTGAGADAGTV